ncbi:MAG TPA: flagellar biosynthetic protein FliQ [Gammaproteobacteria bacterium]|jgi:flagellar biosynthetic protein FliQ|nr:flagellar biosynthetic protein FliQ [Gammaproteobacteria bacterium]
MTPDAVISLGQGALTVTVLVAAPILMSALAVGLLVGMFQAATQVNEMTLSFIPKLLAVVLVLFAAGPWILTTMIDYTRRLITDLIPLIIGG